MHGFSKHIPCAIQEYEVYHPNSSEELIKCASENVDLPDDFVYDPDYLYLWVRIISAGEYYGPNKNGDYFPEEELIKYYKTFKTAHVFKNHENKNVEHAIGAIISTRWNHTMKCVEVFKSIDKKRAPEIARGFIKGYLTDVSMGCKVPYTICSVCGNKARKKSEFCIHVNRYRMQYLGNGERVFEINFEPNFHDSSAVLNGAERVAKATFVIDTPPSGAKVAFKKVASRNGTERYVKVGAQMAKVASEVQLHPLFLKEKQAEYANGLFSKLAQIEKELTGKILNVVTSESGEQNETASSLIDMIRFLTDKRMDEENVKNIAETLKQVSKENGVSLQKVLTVFFGIAELMGIQLYPKELYDLLSQVTDAGLNDELALSDAQNERVMPSDLIGGEKKVLEATKQLPETDSANVLFDLFNESAYRPTEFAKGPMSFLKTLVGDSSEDDHVPVRVIKVIRKTLTPLMPIRSAHSEHIHPRMMSVVIGNHPLIGGDSAAKDLKMMTNPESIGDLLGLIGYRMYQDARPNIVRSKIIRLAMSQDSELEKTAFFWKDVVDAAEPATSAKSVAPAFDGIPRSQLFLWGVPGVFALSAFQKNRREHGKNLSDAEDFLADHPAIASGSLVYWGKPVSRGAYNVYNFSKNKINDLRNRVLTSSEVNKQAKDWLQGLSKTASISPNQYRAFHTDFMQRLQEDSGLSAYEMSGVKTATLLAYGGMEKEAKAVLDHYELPGFVMDWFLKEAYDQTKQDILEKAANDFAKNMVMDGLLMPHTLVGTLPGRMLDAFVITKLMQKYGPNAQVNSQTPAMPRSTTGDDNL